MKSFLLLAFLFSSPVYANDLIGLWGHCDSSDKDLHIRHLIEFDKNNLEYEVHVAHEPHAKPCAGKMIMVMGNNWHYELAGDKFKSMLFTSHAVLLDKKSANILNKNRICGHSKWKLDERVDCINEKNNSFGLKLGLKTEHRYLVSGDELEVTTKEGEIILYKKNP